MVIDVHGEQGMAPLQSTPIKKNVNCFALNQSSTSNFTFVLQLQKVIAKRIEI
jgi:hypothetical protein